MEWPKSKNNKMEELLERMSQFEANLAQLISTGMPNHSLSLQLPMRRHPLPMNRNNFLPNKKK